METWSAVAEGLGIASSVFLLIPAIALNKHLREVHDTETSFQQTTSDLFKAMAKESEGTFVQARIPEWSQRDQKLLILGIVSFGLSCLIKLGVALGAADASSPSSATAASAAAISAESAASR